MRFSPSRNASSHANLKSCESGSWLSVIRSRRSLNSVNRCFSMRASSSGSMRKSIRSVCSRFVDTETARTFSLTEARSEPRRRRRIREPSRTIRVEITSARDRTSIYDGVPGQHRHVALTGSLKVQGTKRMGRRIANQLEFVDHRESRARHLSWIKTAAEGKAGRGRYGTSYELLIAVEDWWFGPNDTEEVVTFVET